jgi:hypothetical protein
MFPLIKHWAAWNISHLKMIFPVPCLKKSKGIWLSGRSYQFLVRTCMVIHDELMFKSY